MVNFTQEDIDAIISSFDINGQKQNAEIKAALEKALSDIRSVDNAYDDDTAAGVAGLKVGDLYQTTGNGAAPLDVAGIVMVKQ